MMKLAGLVVILFAAIIVPFAIWGGRVEIFLQNHLLSPASEGLIAFIVFLALAADVLLPIPSSLVSAAAVTWLGPVTGAVVVWSGMTVGHMVGFAIGHRFGMRAVERISGFEAAQQLSAMGCRSGMIILVALTRAVPVLSEACTIVAGASGMVWTRFLAVVVTANLGVALVYGTVIVSIDDSASLISLFAASIFVPVLGYAILRLFTRQAG